MSRSTLTALVVVMVLAGALLAVLAFGFGRDPHEVPSVLVGREAPGCDLSDLDGGAVSLAGLRGKPVVINFWSTWCVPCEAEHGVLQQAAAAYGQTVQFVGVIYQDTIDAARDYLRRRGNTYLQVVDPASHCAIDYGVAGVPETFFIDSAGLVRHKQVGPLTPGGLANQLAALVAMP